jgi:hypothetical protein
MPLALMYCVLAVCWVAIVVEGRKKRKSWEELIYLELPMAPFQCRKDLGGSFIIFGSPPRKYYEGLITIPRIFGAVYGRGLTSIHESEWKD